MPNLETIRAASLNPGDRLVWVHDQRGHFWDGFAYRPEGYLISKVHRIEEIGYEVVAVVDLDTNQGVQTNFCIRDGETNFKVIARPKQALKRNLPDWF